MNKPNPLGNLKKLSEVAKMVTKAETTLKLDRIYTTTQVRKKFRNLDELAESFRVNGIIEPLVVHEEPDGRHRVIVGERRYRAAPLAGLDEVPVIIKRGLTEQEIRRMQVAENEERDDLTPHEKAMGVIEDVDSYGVKEAMKIWNVTSEGWISKRVAVKRYLPITLSMLEDELSGDLEILHTINKIEQLDAAVATEYREQLERGEPLHRDSVRTRLNMMELQVKERKEKEAERASQPAQTAGGQAEVSAAAPTAGAKVVALHDARQDSANNTAGQGGSKAPVSKLKVAPRTAPHVDAEAAAAREKTAKGERLYAIRSELFDYGRDNESCFKELQGLMFDLGHSVEEGEWVLWTGFLDMILPMLERLGPDRSRAYLKRLQVDMKGTTAGALWTQLHPAAAIDDAKSGTTSVPVMPEGWKF